MDIIIKELEARKFKLANMLKFESENIALERQHQIYGAIKEIDLFLGMVSEMQAEKAENWELKSVPKQELMNKIVKRLK